MVDKRWRFSGSQKNRDKGRKKGPKGKREEGNFEKYKRKRQVVDQRWIAKGGDLVEVRKRKIERGGRE